MPRPLRCTQAEHDMASMRSLRAPCVPSLCAHFGSLLCVPALRTPVCLYCVHGVLVQFVVDMCVLEPMPAARAHAVRARAVHPRAGRVVHLCSVRSDRATSARQRRRHRGGAPARALCWRCACLRCRACVPHARVACTCCACACYACLRYVRLRFLACTCCACPCCACLRCVLACGVWCTCAALIYIVWSSPTLHPRRPWRPAMTLTLSPFSVTYACSCHVIMDCSSLFAPFLACVVPSFYSIFSCILCPVPACGCASERWHRSRCPQLNFPATYLCLLCLPAALLSFLLQKKKTRRPCACVVPPLICSVLLLRFLCVCISAI